MRKLLVLLALLACVVSSHGRADNARVVATCGTVPQVYQAGTQRDVTQDINGNLCTAASVSASIAGFAPGGNFANLTATNVSASVALPSGAVVAFFNTGTTAVSCTLGVGSATATANQNIIQASSWMAFTVGSNTFGACIDQTGSASNVVVLSGGSGIPTGAGGGAAGGGGGSVTQGTTPWVDSITTWGGGTLGAMANYGTSPGAVLVPGVNAFITNTPTVSVPTWAGGTLGAMANYGTSPGAVLVPGVNSFITNTPTVSVPTWAGGTLGSMANYGTSPGAVLVPGVNAFVTNSNANNQATMANSSPVVIASDQTGPCTSRVAINQTSSTDLVTLTNHAWICSVVLISATAQNISLVYGTGTVCATGTNGMIGGTTASIAVAANGGFSSVAAFPWLRTGATAQHLCLLQSGAGNVSGVITYMDHS